MDRYKNSPYATSLGSNNIFWFWLDDHWGAVIWGWSFGLGEMLHLKVQRSASIEHRVRFEPQEKTASWRRSLGEIKRIELWVWSLSCCIRRCDNQRGIWEGDKRSLLSLCLFPRRNWVGMRSQCSLAMRHKSITSSLRFLRRSFYIAPDWLANKY